MNDAEEPLRSRRPRLLPIACTILAAQLLSFILLVLGFPIWKAVGYPVAAASCFLARRVIHVAVFSSGTWACRAISPLGNRRTYRYRLSTLFIFVGLVCCVLGWHSYKRHTFDDEYRALAGRWRAINDKGDPITIKGKEIIQEISRLTSTLIDISSDIHSIDFRLPDGTTSEAIYRWEGDRLRFMQVSVGVIRPKSFDKNERTYVGTDFLLERVPDR